MIPMTETLQRVSGFAFYALGAALFTAWGLLTWGMETRLAAQALQSLDLPFALSAIVYGGTSVYRSVRDDIHPSKTLPWLIGIPLGLAFLVVVILNFGA